MIGIHLENCKSVRVCTGLKYLNIQDCLEKSMKIILALKSTWKTLKGLEVLPFTGGFNTVFMPPKELWEAYSNRTVSPSRFRVRSISPIFFEVGIPNLVCGYILGWRSVAYHFRVTVTLTLTSDLVFRIIVSGAYLFYYLR